MPNKGMLTCYLGGAGTLGNTERVFKNAKAETVREIEATNPGDFSAIQQHVSGELYRRSFQETGDAESSVW